MKLTASFYLWFVSISAPASLTHWNRIGSEEISNLCAVIHQLKLAPGYVL